MRWRLTIQEAATVVHSPAQHQVCPVDQPCQMREARVDRARLCAATIDKDGPVAGNA